MTAEEAANELMAIARTIRERDPWDAVHRFMERIAVRDDTAELQGALIVHGCLTFLANARMNARPEDAAVALRALNPES